MTDEEAQRKAYELLGAAAAGWPVAPEVWEIIRQGYVGSRSHVSPTNQLLRRVKAMATKAEKAEAAAEARAEEKAERLAEDKAAVAEQAAAPETSISTTPVLSTATGERREGTHTREGVNGFVEVIDTVTGDVVARYEQGGPRPD